MARTKPRKHKTSGKFDRLIGDYVARIQFAGNNPHPDIYRFKTNLPPDVQFTAFRHVFPNPDSLDIVHGPAFPQTFDELFIKLALPGSTPILNEIVWAANRVIANAGKIRRFVSLRDTFERFVLANDRASAEECLATIQTELGRSLWLLQNHISTVFAWQSSEGLRIALQALEAEAAPGSFITFLGTYFSVRTESAQRREAQRDALQQTINRMDSTDDLKRYLIAKLFDLYDIRIREASSLLVFDAQSSLIDHYDSLIAILQSAATSQAVTTNAIRILQKPLTALYKATNDPRLRGVMRAFGILFEDEVNAFRAKVIEAYTGGHYDDAADLSSEYLSLVPEDMAAYVLQIRACARTGRPPTALKDILGTIGADLWHLFRASPTAYQSAFSVLTLSDRFFAQSWMQYLRAVVLHELETEEASFPSRALRRIYVLDPQISPFSRLACMNARASDNKATILRELYPLTTSIYKAASSGISDTSLALDEKRERWTRKTGQFFAAG